MAISRRTPTSAFLGSGESATAAPARGSDAFGATAGSEAAQAMVQAAMPGSASSTGAESGQWAIDPWSVAGSLAGARAEAVDIATGIASKAIRINSLPRMRTMPGEIEDRSRIRNERPPSDTAP